MESPPCPQCPAAYALSGPPVGGPSVICGVLQREDATDDSITAGQSSPHITLAKDPSMYLGLCTGRELPTIDGEADESGRFRQHYTSCTIWQQEKERLWADQERAWTPIDRYRQPENDEDWKARLLA